MTLTPEAAAAGRSATPVSPTALYDAALRRHTDGLPVDLWLACASASRPLPLTRWCAAPQDCEPADVIALEVLRRSVPAAAAVLDLGCGPGRHTGYLTDRGLLVLGVDTSLQAVTLARARGARAVWGDGLACLPAGSGPDASMSGLWDAVLLLDGNVGIGGDPCRLLRRVRALLTMTGRLLVELDADDVTDAGTVRLSDGTHTSASFPWARLSQRDLPGVAEAAGLTVLQEWTTDARVFALVGPVRL